MRQENVNSLDKKKSQEKSPHWRDKFSKFIDKEEMKKKLNKKLNQDVNFIGDKMDEAEENIAENTCRRLREWRKEREIVNCGVRWVIVMIYTEKIMESRK